MFAVRHQEALILSLLGYRVYASLSIFEALQIINNPKKIRDTPPAWLVPSYCRGSRRLSISFNHCGTHTLALWPMLFGVGIAKFNACRKFCGIDRVWRYAEDMAEMG